MSCSNGNAAHHAMSPSRSNAAKHAMNCSRVNVARRSHAGGFTLLEVMLAFVLLATAMGLLIAMLSNGLRQVRQAQDETDAALYAQSLLDQIGVLEAIVPVQREGEFDHGRYHYQLQISEARDPIPPRVLPNAPATPATVTIAAPKLFRIAVLVTWGAAQQTQRLQLVTLRARAAPLFEGSRQ